MLMCFIICWKGNNGIFMLLNRALFSVCICSYKNIEEIHKSVESIVRQTYENIELIVSDDCTPIINVKKKIEDIIRPYEGRFTNIIINVNDTNLGTVKHLNYILPKAKGTYITLLGAGDELDSPDTIAHVVNYFETNVNIDILIANRTLELPRKKKLLYPSRKYKKILLQGNSKKILKYECRVGRQLSSIGTFYRKQVIERYGFFDERFVIQEDSPFFLRALYNNEIFGYINLNACVHEAGGVSNLARKNSVFAQDCKNTLIYYKYPKRYEMDIFTRHVIELRYEMRVKNNYFACLKYPIATAYLVFALFMDWIKRIRFLK